MTTHITDEMADAAARVLNKRLAGRNGLAGVSREMLVAALSISPDYVPQLGGAPEDLRNFVCGVFEHFGMEGLTKVVEYAYEHRGHNAFTGKPLVP